MNISPNSILSEPTGSDQIPIGTLGYMRARNKHRIYSLVIDEFRRSGISQADLARRLGKTNQDGICRWLAAPGNWTLNTVSDLLFAISGAEAAYALNHPLTQAQRNDTKPDWIGSDWGLSNEDKVPTKTTGANVLDFSAAV